MKLLILITWKPDADPAAIEAFLQTAPEQLAAGPFVSFEHGTTMNPSTASDKRSPKGALLADWGWIAELSSDDSKLWSTSEPHRQMEEKLAPILGTMTVLSWKTEG